MGLAFVAGQRGARYHALGFLGLPDRPRLDPLPWGVRAAIPAALSGTRASSATLVEGGEQLVPGNATAGTGDVLDTAVRRKAGKRPQTEDEDFRVRVLNRWSRILGDFVAAKVVRKPVGPVLFLMETFEGKATSTLCSRNCSSALEARTGTNGRV